MDSAGLTLEQLDKLLHAIARSRDYTFRLVERMNAQGFPDDDSLKAASARARDAVEALYQVAQSWSGSRSCPSGRAGRCRRSPSRGVGGRGGTEARLLLRQIGQ